MSGKEKILKDMEFFMVDIFERQKQLDLEIYVDSSPKNIFKKKDYQGHIDEYKKLKDLALRIDPATYEPDAEDEALLELVVVFEELLALYNLYCDRGLNVQTYLKRKHDGEKYPYGEYSEAVTRQKSVNEAFSKTFNEFSVLYSEYTQGA